MTDTITGVPVGVAAIRMQLDRKDQPHAFYQVRCELDGSAHAGWKRWSECRQFAYAVALQTIDAPRFPSHKFISVINSNAGRLISNRCLDPDYLERRRLSLEIFFKDCYAKSPVAVARFLDAGKEPETEGGVLDAMYPPTPHAPTPSGLREPLDASDRFSRAEEAAAAMTEDRARRNTERRAAARRALLYDAPAAAPSTARRRVSPVGRRVSFSSEPGDRGPTSAMCLLWAALLGGLLSVVLGWAAAPPEPATSAGSWAELWSSASARLVCAVMQNSSEVAQCAKPDAVGSLDAAALQACGVRTCQASDALLLPRRWLAVEPTPVTLVLVYVLLTVAALVPRKWLDSLPW